MKTLQNEKDELKEFVAALKADREAQKNKKAAKRGLSTSRSR